MLLTTTNSYHMLSLILNIIQKIHEISFKMIYKKLNLTEREQIKLYLKIHFSDRPEMLRFTSDHKTKEMNLSSCLCLVQVTPTNCKNTTVQEQQFKTKKQLPSF